MPVKVAVAHLRTFRIHLRELLAEGLRAWHILIAQRPCFGELTGGILFAVEQLCNSRAAVLTWQIHIEHRVNLIKKRQLHRRTAEQHDDHPFAAAAQRVDLIKLILRQSHVLAVAALGLIFIRQTGKDKNGVARVERNALDTALPKDICRCGNHGRVDHGASGALIAHILKQFTGDVQLLGSAQRQHAVVFHQYGTLGGKLRRQCMVRFPIYGSRFGRTHTGVDPFQDVAASLVQRLHRKRAIRNAVQNPTPTNSGITGHFEVKTCLESLHSVTYGAPVGHHNTVKAPLVAQHIGKQPFVLRAKDAVDLVVGTHQGGRLCPFDDILKRLQIQPAHGVFRSDRVAEKAVILAVVHRKMLHAYTDALTLHTLGLRRRHHTGEQRILAEILKVPSAKGIALDIHTGSEQGMNTVVTRFLSDRLPHSARDVRIPT